MCACSDLDQLKAVTSYYLMFSHVEWPESLNVASLIFFATGYFSEKHLFVAFICWLIHKDVDKQHILESGFLHSFFEYNSFDIAFIETTYQLMAAFSREGKAFFDYLNDKSCLMPFYMNNKRNDRYESRNLVGTTYLHHSLENLKKREYSKNIFFSDHINPDTLYFLFGREYLEILFQYYWVYKKTINSLFIGEYQLEVLTELAEYLLYSPYESRFIKNLEENLDFFVIEKLLQDRNKHPHFLIEISPIDLTPF